MSDNKTTDEFINKALDDWTMLYPKYRDLVHENYKEKLKGVLLAFLLCFADECDKFYYADPANEEIKDYISTWVETHCQKTEE
jgi:hypothetical protein